MREQNVLNAARKLITLALEEDLNHRGDITTLALAAEQKNIRASIIAKQDGTLCGLDIINLIFQHIDPDISIEYFANDGDRVVNRQSLVELTGSSESLLIAERTCLNFLGRLSGIASQTRRFVDAVQGTGAKILDTRKTTPGWRALEKYAVTCGGGENHRDGLYDMFLIKENHVVAAGGIRNAVEQCRSYMASMNFQAAIEVEAQNFDGVKQALSLNVDRIMLDNMSLENMRICVRFVDHQIPLEASGNILLSTVSTVAETGVDYISIGALTHSAKSLDISMLFH